MSGFLAAVLGASVAFVVGWAIGRKGHFNHLFVNCVTPLLRIECELCRSYDLAHTQDELRRLGWGKIGPIMGSDTYYGVCPECGSGVADFAEEERA